MQVSRSNKTPTTNNIIHNLPSSPIITSDYDVVADQQNHACQCKCYDKYYAMIRPHQNQPASHMAGQPQHHNAHGPQMMARATPPTNDHFHHQNQHQSHLMAGAQSQQQQQPPPLPPQAQLPAIDKRLQQQQQIRSTLPKSLYNNMNASSNNNNIIPQHQSSQTIAPPAGSSHLINSIQHSNHQDPAQIRLTLPLRETPLVKPFRLDHDTQFTTKVFHLKPQLFDTLSKSMNLINPKTATVIQELQFKCYIVTPVKPGQGDSLLASNHHHHNHHHQTKQSMLVNWPEFFQVTINQQLVHLDSSPVSSSSCKSVDVFQYCQPGENLLEIQVNDCYCHYEFVLEPVDRPTMRAFMNSCYKSRMLSLDSCLAKLRHTFGSPGFVPNQAQSMQCLQSSGIINEYISEYVQTPAGQQLEETRVRISLSCPLSARRMRTPIRGPYCKHLQCFDLENFLHTNCDKSQWQCPICFSAIPFNMLELDQHQLQMVQQADQSTDDILISADGQWQTYYQPIQAPQLQPQSVQQGPAQAKSAAIFHPQPQMYQQQQHQQHQSQQGQPMHVARRTPNWQQQDMGPAGEPAMHMMAGHRTGSPMSAAVRRPPSALGQQQTQPAPAGGRRSANGSPLAKRAHVAASGYASSPPTSHQQRASATSIVANSPGQQAPSASPYHPPTPARTSKLLESTLGGPDEHLSPLAAMERTIIQHEQQMGPPPFDPNTLAVASPLARTSSSTTPVQQQHQPSPSHDSMGAHSPLVSSPGRHLAGSLPATGTQVPASPLAQQSPKQQVPSGSSLNSASTPATPIVGSSTLASEQPMTPAGLHSSMVPASQPMASNTSCSNANAAVVDHAPLSNGSASAGSITSSSTMTPSSQSLGSVGMGGDSRCNTAPLNSQPGGGSLAGNLDDLILSAGSSTSQQAIGSPYANGSACASGLGGRQQINNSTTSLGYSMHTANSHTQTSLTMNTNTTTTASSAIHDGHNHHQHSQQQKHQFNHQQHQQQQLMVDEKNHELLMSKLSSAASAEHGELGFALEEAEWKHQLDRGKSEHLANFLNDPLMTSASSNKRHLNHHYSSNEHHSIEDGSNKMLSGGLNPSDDENEDTAAELDANNPSATRINELDQFVGYIDAAGPDDGAGLPPEDRILDIFER